MKKILTILTAFLLCASNSFAYYDEAIATNKEFYIYNVATKRYIGLSGSNVVLESSIDKAATWKFNGTNVNNLSLKNGDRNYLQIGVAKGISASLGFIKYEKEPEATATGDISISQTETRYPIEGDKNGYMLYAKGTYGVSFGSIGTSSRNFYLSDVNGNIKSVQRPENTTIAENYSKWKLISKRQIDNTITLDPESLTLDAIQGGEAATSVFNVNYSGNPTSISITNGTTTLTISSPAASQHAINVAYQVAGNGTQTFTLTDGSNDSNKATFSFASASSATLSLTISTTAASGNAIDADKKPMTITGNVTALAHQEIRWTQDFTALSLTSAAITLDAQAVDKNGAPTGKTVSYTLSSTGVVKIESGKLYVLSEGTTSITAKVDKDATYVGAEKTLTINVSGIPAASKTITSTEAASSGIYTGTIGGPSTTYTFHRGKRQVDLSKCFNSSKQALFDSLYIFGVTTNTDGVLVSYKGTDNVQYSNVPQINTPETSVVCNATTPCYVFAKTDNTTYTYTRTFDAVKTRYDWGTKQNGKHIYFTGYCPFVYVGETSSQNGWMYFTGGNTKVDIYLDSCQIMGRYKTPSGANSAYKEFILEMSITKTGEGEGDVNVNYLSGSSSPFVFTSTTKQEGQSYKPYIHIAGRNHLRGQMGLIVNSTYGNVDIAGMVSAPINLGVSGVPLVSSPITVLPTEIGQFTDLVLTDIWKDESITNGFLKLNAEDVRASESALSIDLGSEYATLTINGGQYHLRNSAADGNYTCNMAVGYKTYKRTVEAFSTVVQAELYGFGNDQAESVVEINSGTFTMYKNMYPDGSGYLGADYYKDQKTFLDLRLPAGNEKSRINGGTFNGISNVVMCQTPLSTGAAPMNGNGEKLTLKDIDASVNSEGATVFTLSDFENIDDYYLSDYIAYNLVTSEVYDNVKNGLLYGAQSVNAYKKSEKNQVSLLLPSGMLDVEPLKETFIESWVTAFPKFDVQKQIAGVTSTASIGGPTDASVAGAGQDIVYDIKQLLYLDLDGIGDAEYQLAAQGAGLKLNDVDNPRGQIRNNTSYEIQDNINMIKVVQADTWYTFTAPFDVKSISVIETSNNASVENPTLTKSQAAVLQAQGNLGLWYGIYTLILPDDLGRTSSQTFDQMIATTGSVKHTLLHYNGTKAADNNLGTSLVNANYYLYELDPDSLTDGEMVTDGAGTSLNIDWKPVKREANAPLMYQGKTYAIQFPYCPMCDDAATRKYDYWSNKMILFYGKGPQWILGGDEHTTILATSPADGRATLTGNYTFKDMTLSRRGGFVHNQSNDMYEQNTSNYIVKPTEGYLLYNSGQSQMPARISRLGEIVYPDNTTTDTEGVPTIGERTSIMLFDAAEGFDILSLRAQMVAVYNLQGEVLMHKYMAEGERVYLAAPAGLYVVKGEKDAIKIMVD